MKKKDTETIRTAIESAIKHGVGDTYELTNGKQFFVSWDKVNEFELTISGEYDEVIKFYSVKTFLEFIS